MHNELWVGVELKIDHAAFFLAEMGNALTRPDGTEAFVALQASDAITGTGWPRSFYAYLDGFLAMARSVPEVILWCFGEDQQMKKWLRDLTSEEQQRRQEFNKRFKTAYDVFRALPLSKARNISLHRSGVAPVVVSVVDRFGVSHIGTPVTRVPDALSIRIEAGSDPVLQWATTLPPESVLPAGKDFTIDDQDLFLECRTYLAQAGTLVELARAIVHDVHGPGLLTTPPSV